MNSSKNPKCPVCHQESKKYGIRKNKLQQIQQYKCKSCGKKFTEQRLKHKTYPLKIILNAISSYNLGNTLEASAKLTNSRFKTNITAKNVQLWVNELKEQLPFSKIRDECKKLYTPKNMLFKKQLQHQQVFLFQYHKAKLHLLFRNIKYNNMFTNQSRLYPLKNYLEKIPTSKFPHHIFKSYETKIKEGIIKQSPSPEIEKIRNQSISIISPEPEIAQSNNAVDNNTMEQRASQLKFPHLKITHLSKNNFANKLSKLALETASSKSKAHSAIEKFFLINDSTTIATEVPVYLTNDDIKYFKDRKFEINLDNYTTPITGHIDILQIRNGLIHILDYKPEADKISPIEQLTIYALALASRTKLALRDFKCAWFDESNYFEFFPLHSVYPKTKKIKA